MIFNQDFREFVKLLIKNSDEYLIIDSYDITLDARPLKRTIQKYLINPLSQELLMDNFESGDIIYVSVGDKGKLVFSK